MALNLIPDRGGREPLLATDLRAIERHLDDDHYVREWNPARLTLTGAGSARALDGNRWEYIAFADGLNTARASGSARIPSQWRGGNIKITAIWSGSAASTANFRTNYTVTWNKIGANATTSTLVYSANRDLAGPAMIGDWKQDTFYTTSAVPADADAFAISILANRSNPAVDPYTGESWLYLVVAELVQSVREAQ